MQLILYMSATGLFYKDNNFYRKYIIIVFKPLCYLVQLSATSVTSAIFWVWLPSYGIL